MRGIFEELITEASVGKVLIEEEEWPIAFNTKILSQEGEIHSFQQKQNFSTLIIKDEKKFLTLLEEYISLELQKNRKMPNFSKEETKNRIKWLMAYLFANATTEDFLNPEELIRRNIAFLKDDTFDYLENGVEVETGPSLQNSRLWIQKKESSTSMETANKIEISLRKTIDGKEVEYSLPSIYYGIREGTCYI